MDVGGLEAHEVGQLVDDELSLRGAFVDAFDAAALPVGPVDEVAQQSEAEDVRKFVLHQHPSARPVHVHHLGDGERGLHTERAQRIFLEPIQTGNRFDGVNGEDVTVEK